MACCGSLVAVGFSRRFFNGSLSLACEQPQISPGPDAAKPSAHAALVVDEVVDTGTVVRLCRRTAHPDGVCPRCGSRSRGVHAWHVRRPTDLPVAGRSLVIELRVRRLVCQTTACPQRTFRQHDTIPPDEADEIPASAQWGMNPTRTEGVEQDTTPAARTADSCCRGC